MGKTRLHEKQLQDENGNWMKLEYFLLLDADEGWTEYGVEVRLRRAAEETWDAVHRFTTRRECICALIDRLAEHTVTPVALRDVLEDWL